MAYMSQEHKAEIAKLLKEVVPKDWKYSLKVHHHSTLICTVWSAPVDVLGLVEPPLRSETHYNVNTYWYKDHIKDEALREQVGKIIDAMNQGNWDRSDHMTDYFDVGHYIDLTFGNWEKPFQNTSPPALQASA
jgi:hypothetical protein